MEDRPLDSHPRLREPEDRRAFLCRIGRLGVGTVTAPAFFSLFGVLPLGCGDEEEPLIVGSSGDSVTYGVRFAGVDRHIHTFSILKSTLSNPPAAGITDSTSNSSGHTHSLTLSQQQLTDIDAATSVTGTTERDSGDTHAHGFDFPN
jgi:hypothetical protein